MYLLYSWKNAKTIRDKNCDILFDRRLFWQIKAPKGRKPLGAEKVNR